MARSLQVLDELLNILSCEECKCNREYALIFHGGAGNIISNDIYTNPNNEHRQSLFKELGKILQSAHRFCEMGLNGKLSAVDIAEKVVILLEDSPYFNAGKGATFTNSGHHELEASIMNGKDLKCGAVSLLNNLRNPISAAVDIMNTTKHVYLIGDGAKKHLEHLLTNTNYYETNNRTPPSFEDPSYFWTEKWQKKYEKMKKEQEMKAVLSENEGFETVGCVVMLKGDVAAATSTGGMTYKLNGRIGDSPIIGAGTYADNKYGAVSCTGIGEEFMRRVSAYDIIARSKYCKISLQQAIEVHLNECFDDGVGGAIAVDSKGNFGIAFNTTLMIRGYLSSDNRNFGHIGLLKDDLQTVCFDD